ncbi:hypothetical protein K8I61_04525 [bacterium]|nr:hypothetical protein [bacterium]
MYLRTIWLVILLVVVMASSSVAAKEEQKAPDETTDEIVLEDGGTMLIFDARNGSLLHWSSGQHVLIDSPPSSDYETAEAFGDFSQGSISVGTGRSDCDFVDPHSGYLIDTIDQNGACLGFGLYLFKQADGWGSVLDGEVLHPMEFEMAYDSWWNGLWLHHQWSVYGMSSIHTHNLGLEFWEPNATHPDIVASENDPPVPLFTVEAEVRVQLDGTVRWRNIGVYWDNGGIPPGEGEEDWFGIYGVQYPITRRYDTGQPYSSGSSPDYLVLPVSDGLELNNPMYNLWNSTQAASTAYHNYEPVRWGEEISLLEKEDSLGTVSTWVRNYPDGYQMTMPFLAYYSTDTARSAGTYFVIPDTSMKAKSFIVRARDYDANSLPDKFDFSYVHWSDDVCESYSNDGHPDTFDKVCQWGMRDFGPTTYEVRMEPLTERNWYQPAERYRDWARANAPWWGTLNKHKHPALAPFYQYAGIAVGGLGSQQNVSNANQNFVGAFRALLKQNTPNLFPADDARVLFVQGWDWSSSDISVRSSFFNRGRKYTGGSINNLEYWRAHFGPTDPTRTQNRGAIMRDADAGAPYYNANKAGDYLVPYIDSLSLCYGGGEYPCDGLTWDGYERSMSYPSADNPGAPWIDRRIMPDTSGDGYRKVRMNPALADVRSFFADRDLKVVMDPFGGLYGVDKPLSGLYHDVGVTFNVALSFRAHEAFQNPQDKIPAYLPSHGITAPHFQVGRGGFTFEAARDMLGAVRYSGAEPHLMGTERMSEIFVDLQDFYSAGEDGSGPLRRFDIGSHDGLFSDCCGQFTGESKWIMEGAGKEIPLLPFVYHPAMPVRTSSLTLSGGGDATHVSANNIGDIFYWVAARAYLLYGGIASLFYDNVPIDLLSFPDPGMTVPLPTTLDPDGTTYQLGWIRNGSPETPADPQNGIDQGRYECGQSGFAGTCSYGDPQKEKYLRMLAFLRNYRLTKYVAYGDMRREGTFSLNFPPPIYAPYSYEFYMARSQPTEDCRALPWLICNDDECLEHDSVGTATCPSQGFQGERFIHNSWKDADPPQGQKPEIVYVLANLYGSTLNLNYTVDISSEYGSTPGYACALTFSPNTANFPNWSGSAPWTVNGSQTLTSLSIPSKNVLVIRIKPTSSCA